MSVRPDIKLFDFEHLPTHLQLVSQPFGELARHVEAHIPDCVEKDVALRKLLESKDAAVRAVVMESKK